jgi:hypothetical protein
MFSKVGKKSVKSADVIAARKSGYTGILPDTKLVSRRVEIGYSATGIPDVLSVTSISDFVSEEGMK